MALPSRIPPRVVVLVGSCLLAASTWAAPITFDQALRAALSTHPLVAGRRSAEAAARSDREAADWQRYPTPSIQANTRNDISDPNVFRLDQPLWTGGRITATIAAAGSRVDAAACAIDEARQDVALKVIIASSEVVRQQARQRYNQAGVDEHEKLLAMIRRRVAQEVSPLADQRLAESRMYSMINDLSSTRQALANALAQLTQLTGQSVTAVDPASVEVAARGDDLPADLATDLDLDMARSPTLRRLKFEAEAADADIDVKRSAYLPQVLVRLENSHMGGTIPDTRAVVVFQAEPGAGLSASSGVDAAVARREAARQAMEAARRDVRQQLTQDWNEWTAARSRMDNAEQVRGTSAEVSDSYARQYTAGRKTWLDVMNAAREANQAELALVDAKSQLQAAALRLKVQTGVLNLAVAAP